MKPNKPKPWNGRALSGEWTITRKLDGVRALKAPDGSIVSRSGKPLYNLDHAFDTLGLTDAEVFLGSWEETVSAVRTHNGAPVPPEALYSLSPLDPRLLGPVATSPSAADIRSLLRLAVSLGDEGLVLRQGDAWIKVKPTETLDLEVTGVIPGKGKHEGRMGALMTERGKVGQGFTDAQREEEWAPGMVIEVSYRTLTPAGKLKEGRFVRRREDKEIG